MKKLIFFIAFVFCFLVVEAQFPITQSIGSPTTLVQVPANGGFRAGIINRTFADTTAANATYLDYYVGAQIFTTTDGKFWIRNATATGWVDITNGGSGINIYNSDGTLSGNRNLYINSNDLSFYSGGIASSKVLYFSPTSNYIGNPTSTRQLLLYPDSVLLVNTDQSASSSDSVLVRTSTGRLKTRAQSQISATIPISSLLAATVTNDIDNTNYTQTWRWTGTTLNALELYNSTTASLTNTRTLYVSRSGAHASSNRQTFAGQFANAHTGTNSTNIGISGIAGAGTINKSGYFAAGTAGTTNYAVQAEWTTNGGTDNYGGHFTSSGVGTNNIAGYFSATNGTSRNDAIIVPSGGGNVGIGTSSPAKVFHTVGTVRMASLGTASSDTTTNKPLGINSSGDVIPMTYWPGGGGSGVTSLAAIGSSPNANGGTISGSVLNLEPASGSFGGVVTTGTQTIAGSKSFVDQMILGTTGSGSLKLRDPNGTYNFIETYGGPLTIYGSSTYGQVDITSLANGRRAISFAMNNAGYNLIGVDGLMYNSDTTHLSNTGGVYDIGRTFGYQNGGVNGHGYTDQTIWKRSEASFNSFSSFVHFGNNSANNMGHYAAFQSVWSKDSSNTTPIVYDFVSAVSTVTGGTVTDLYGFYKYDPTVSGGASLTNQYGIYLPKLRAATNNWGLLLDSNDHAFLGGNLYIGDSSSKAASARNTVSIFNGSQPSASVTNGVTLYAEDIATKSALQVRNEDGVVTLLTGRTDAFVQTQFNKTSSTALGDVTNLTANVAAGKAYRFEAILYTTSNSSGGVKAAISGTATATTIIYEGLTTDAGTTTQSRATSLGTAVGAVTAVTAAYIKITGTIIVNAAGTLTVQFAQNASNGSASSVLVGSTFHVIELPYFP